MGSYREFLESFVGTIEVVADEKWLLGIDLAREPGADRPNTLTRMGVEWLQSYFAGMPADLDLPIRPASTPFLRRVREAVMGIEPGRCLSYKDVAIAVGSPGAYRAVAMAMKRNPYAIYVPCHRVVGSSGIGGYTPGIDIKKKLLEFEKCESINL